MKTNVKKIILAAVATTFISLLTFADSAEIISVKGKVEVSRGDAWITLKAGDTVTESETISTGFQSEAKIKYKDSIMQLGALSRVTLSKLSTSSTKDVVDVYLNTGAVRSKVNHSADKKVNYTVRNPVAVASVRGTEFISCDDGTIICFSGAVVLTPAALYEHEPENADETPDPAEGESNAGTSVQDVDPNAPENGGVMVLEGQASQITSIGTAASTFEVAVQQVTQAAATVTTAASSESVSMGSSAATVVEKITESGPKTGNIDVEFMWPIHNPSVPSNP